MLTLNGEEFTSGISTYSEEDLSFNTVQNSISVSVILKGDVSIAVFARLDPATPWVVCSTRS